MTRLSKVRKVLKGVFGDRQYMVMYGLAMYLYGYRKTFGDVDIWVPDLETDHEIKEVDGITLDMWRDYPEVLWTFGMQEGRWVNGIFCCNTWHLEEIYKEKGVQSLYTKYGVDEVHVYPRRSNFVKLQSGQQVHVHRSTREVINFGKIECRCRCGAKRVYQSGWLGEWGR